VLTTVEFNRQLKLGTVEIEDIGIDRMLPTELPLVHPSISQARPKQAFRVGGILAKTPSEGDQFQPPFRIFDQAHRFH